MVKTSSASRRKNEMEGISLQMEITVVTLAQEREYRMDYQD
jgi:hypothetical protein